ncbi:hypothetical protein ES703_19691 [subsurface metagenome]
MTQENESSTEQPGDQPEPAPGPEPEPEPVNIRIQVPGNVNAQLQALAALWGQTKGFTASKLLIGSIQNHYQINKSRGRI